MGTAVSDSMRPISTDIVWDFDLDPLSFAFTKNLINSLPTENCKLKY